MGQWQTWIKLECTATQRNKVCQPVRISGCDERIKHWSELEQSPKRNGWRCENCSKSMWVANGRWSHNKISWSPHKKHVRKHKKTSLLKLQDEGFHRERRGGRKDSQISKRNHNRNFRPHLFHPRQQQEEQKLTVSTTTQTQISAKWKEELHSMSPVHSIEQKSQNQKQEMLM